jgi:predicted nicotinamide N-methyase
MRTEYHGPSTIVTIRVGAVSIRLAKPVEPDRLLDDPEVAALNRTDDYMPYWAYLWPGAFLLAEEVARRDWSGEEALEIGCGLGLAGLVGVAKGLRVRFTDYDDAPLAFLERSAEANGFEPGRYSTARLDWRKPTGECYPVILGADVLYERRLVPLVAGLLARMLAEGGEALIADPYRVSAEDFPAVAAGFGLRCRVEQIEATTEALGVVRGTLHRVRREPPIISG